MKTRRPTLTVFNLLLVAAIALAACVACLVPHGVGMAATVRYTYTYTADVVPDDASLQTAFSYQKLKGTSWHTSNGELVMTTASGAGIWFGNHATYNKVPWQIADNDQGNFASLRAKLGADSGDWELSLIDSACEARFTLWAGKVEYICGASQSGAVQLDTTAYHTYSFVMAEGEVTYCIDDRAVYSGSAAAKSFEAASAKYLLVGDLSGSSAGGYGSMVVDEFTTITATDTMPGAPGQPTNVSPAGAAAGVTLTAALVSSPFSDNVGDTHAASQWQIATTSGDYSSTILDSSTDAANPTSMGIPPGKLTTSTTYYWRVRHQDNHGMWSAWSTETSFTTLSEPPAVTTDDARRVSPSSARLNGSLPSLGTASRVNTSFQWGTTSGDYLYETAAETKTSSGTFYSDLSDLSPGTTYYYRAKADGDGEPIYGDETSFTTGATGGDTGGGPRLWVQLLSGAGAVLVVGMVARVTSKRLARQKR